MGHGSAVFRAENWPRAKRIGRGVLQTLQVVLYLAFIADCMIMVAMTARNAGPDPNAEPVGGGSLILILLAIGLVRRILYGPIDEQY